MPGHDPPLDIDGRPLHKSVSSPDFTSRSSSDTDSKQAKIRTGNRSAGVGMANTNHGYTEALRSGLVAAVAQPVNSPKYDLWAGTVEPPDTSPMFSDIDVYRYYQHITPDDTPELSKDGSEPYSDVSEGTSLNVATYFPCEQGLDLEAFQEEWLDCYPELFDDLNSWDLHGLISLHPLSLDTTLHSQHDPPAEGGEKATQPGPEASSNINIGDESTTLRNQIRSLVTEGDNENICSPKTRAVPRGSIVHDVVLPNLSPAAKASDDLSKENTLLYPPQQKSILGAVLVHDYSTPGPRADSSKEINRHESTTNSPLGMTIPTFISSPQESSGSSTNTTEYDSTSSADFDDELLSFDESPLGTLAQPLLQELVRTFVLRHSTIPVSLPHCPHSTNVIASDAEERSNDASSRAPSNIEYERRAPSNGKRKRRDELTDDNREEEGDGSEDRSPKRLIKEPPTSIIENTLWACPFSKWKPLTYHSCQHSILSGINRVKQHLRRKHKRPLHCPSCWLTFEKETPFYAHIAKRNCDQREGNEPEGVTTEQQTLLERRVDKRLSREEQWYSIYETLFPGKPKPNSPYLESGLSAEFQALEAFMATTGLGIVKQRTREHIPPSLMPHQDDVLAFSQNLFQQAIPEILQRYEASRPPRNNSPDSGYGSLSQANSSSRAEAPRICHANEQQSPCDNPRGVPEPPLIPSSDSLQGSECVDSNSSFPLEVDVTGGSASPLPYEPSHEQDIIASMRIPSSSVLHQSESVDLDEDFGWLTNNNFNDEWWT